jgi:serine/threonine-protein kinase
MIANEETQQRRLGRYHLLSTLGQGGMGTIHLAVAGGLGEFHKLLVVKELRRDLVRNDKFVEMFLAEAKLAARLNHPNVVQTLEAGLEDDRYFLAMEFLDGQPFSQLLKRAGQTPRISLGVRLQVLCDALAGLHYAHTLCDYDGSPLEIVHRDVSPQNVFVTYDGQVKVLDFGIAKAANLKEITHPGVFKGKFAYAAPEQVQGQPVDGRIDVFAIGVMLWEAVAMRRFAPGTPTRESVEARIAGSEPRLAEVSPSIEAELAEICNKAMHVDPSARYANADEFRAALQKYLTTSGATVDAAGIGAALRAKFVDERAAMHRLIDLNVNQTLGNSMVRALENLPNHPGRKLGNDELTTVGDLSKLIQLSRTDNPTAESVQDAPVLRTESARTVGWWIAAFTVGAIGTAVLWKQGEEAPRATPTAVSSPAAPAPSAAPASPGLAQPAVARAEPEPPPPAPQPSAAAPTFKGPATRQAPVARAPRAKISSAPSERAPHAATHRAGEADTHERGERAGASARTPESVAADARAPLAQSRTPGAGTQLHPARAQRPLDLEDPYR